MLADIAKDSGIPVTSLKRLIDLLETMYLVQRTPAWSTNLSKRAVAKPKMSLIDSGLAARLVNSSAVGPTVGADSTVVGHLIEGFVADEIRRQRTWSEESFTVHHFRDRSAGEVDLILETPDGRIAGIEVKSHSRIRGNDAKWLGMLRDRLGSRFTAGVVLNTGQTSGSLGDKLSVVPMDALWAG